MYECGKQLIKTVKVDAKQAFIEAWLVLVWPALVNAQ